MTVPSGALPQTLPDLLQPRLDLVFAGINPGERSARVGHYYGHPGNGFWPALSASGLAGGEVGPTDDRRLSEQCGIGFTDVVKRVVTDSSRVTNSELRAAESAFRERIAAASPRALCFTATRASELLFPGVREPGSWGRQPVELEGAAVWVMPSTSGRAAGWRDEVHRVLGELARDLGRVPTGRSVASR
ncbi:MAG TPA: mismatch-specific DNA-glycosylase [Dehalococcoidia bacterium]|jgi:TDG/mug DNA glycosylase family protein|nr:mismatch-specific DNA-glycosylase [Dehalococcoidia bacterium]